MFYAVAAALTRCLFSQLSGPRYLYVYEYVCVCVSARANPCVCDCICSLLKVQKTRARPFSCWTLGPPTWWRFDARWRCSSCNTLCSQRQGVGPAEGSHFDGRASMEISNDADAVVERWLQWFAKANAHKNWIHKLNWYKYITVTVYIQFTVGDWIQMYK